jgi:hypothetical protein
VVQTTREEVVCAARRAARIFVHRSGLRRDRCSRP